jgi:hypothetical protein
MKDYNITLRNLHLVYTKVYTELVLELEHLKIETRLITEMFPNVMGECENEKLVCLLLINKATAKEKTYILVSVR